MDNTSVDIIEHLHSLDSEFDLSADSIAIILAAGHGKRIKSETSKMLHQIWGVPTVVRVANAAKEGLDTGNQVMVVGIKAIDVAASVGKEKERRFAYQAVQNGTGDAVRIALEATPDSGYDGDLYIFPGDMGLLHGAAVKEFKQAFLQDPCDMMVLTGIYEGDPAENYYGRIVRVPAKDVEGRDAGEEEGKVIEIKEHKDILAIKEDKPYKVEYKGKTYAFSRQELLELREFNTGVYAFKSGPLRSFITKLSTDNVQGELYLTDLISIFNQSGLSVKAAPASDNRTVLGFNVKSVLKEMDNYAREAAYEKLKDIITIADKDDFFIADEVIEAILRLDKEQAPLDITVGKGVYIDKSVRINKGVQIHRDAHITGNVLLNEGVVIQENVRLSTFHGQHLKIGPGTEIFQESEIKGNTEMGANCRIESHVNITGSNVHPTRIGDNVVIKGRTYVYGCIIENDVKIEHSVLKSKKVERRIRPDGSIQPIRYVIPTPEGLDSISPLKEA